MLIEGAAIVRGAAAACCAFADIGRKNKGEKKGPAAGSLLDFPGRLFLVREVEDDVDPAVFLPSFDARVVGETPGLAESLRG